MSDTLQSVAARLQELTLENERLFRELIAAERRFRSLSRSVWRVQEDERRRLARELHDGIGQTLTALKNHLEGSERRSAASGGAPDDSLGEAVAIAAQALQETRELARLLRPAVLDDLGLVPALSWLARTFHGRFAIAVELQAAGLDERFDPDVETLAFRTVQEALTNVAKHAGVDSARVEVSRSLSHLKIKVSDGGRGFDPQQVLAGERGEAGVGLRGMRDRAELLGGTVRIDSRPAGGTRIEVAVPLSLSPGEAAP